jgi:hypothetical protein
MERVHPSRLLKEMLLVKLLLLLLALIWKWLQQVHPSRLTRRLLERLELY